MLFPDALLKLKLLSTQFQYVEENSSQYQKHIVSLAIDHDFVDVCGSLLFQSSLPYMLIILGGSILAFTNPSLPP